ncbi:hypothetical protein BV898_03516 [Hypsibius exemplaris]|uniref:Uncharacterized protein n=1 Tax=Hypsibius exemplaris TaxID=2072580 RepID=A0A1W0X540_HYPEX|nr:hypothetical protein BV898_03516 [Hypsibius exemplaris]
MSGRYPNPITVNWPNTFISHLRGQHSHFGLDRHTTKSLNRPITKEIPKQARKAKTKTVHVCSKPTRTRTTTEGPASKQFLLFTETDIKTMDSQGL